MLLVTSLVIGRSCIVAIKYGYFSPETNDQIRSSTMSEKQILNNLILHGWRQCTDNTITKCLRAAECRLNINLKKIEFALTTNHSNYAAKTTVNAMDLYQQLWKYSEISNEKYTKYCTCSYVQHVHVHMHIYMV